MPETENGTNDAEAKAEHEQGDVKRLGRYFSRYLFPQGGTRMDLSISLATTLLIISGAVLAVPGLFGYWKHQQSIAIWLLYATIVLAVTVFFLNWQKSISNPAKAEHSSGQPTSTPLPPATGRPNLIVDMIDVQPFVEGQPIEVRVYIRNGGEITADLVAIEGAHVIVPSTFKGPLTDEKSSPDTFPTIPADGKFTLITHPVWAITAKQIKELITGDALYFYYATVSYNGQGETRTFDHCFMFERRLQRMKVCPAQYLPIEQTNNIWPTVVQRPYIRIKDFSLIAPLEVGQKQTPGFRMIVVNRGPASAWDVTFYFRIIISKKSFTDAVVEKPLGTHTSRKGGAFFSAGRERTINSGILIFEVPQGLADIKAGRLNLYVVGGVFYRDDAGKEYDLPIRAEYDPASDRFNWADDE